MKYQEKLYFYGTIFIEEMHLKSMYTILNILMILYYYTTINTIYFCSFKMSLMAIKLLPVSTSSKRPVRLRIIYDFTLQLMIKNRLLKLERSLHGFMI